MPIGILYVLKLLKVGKDPSHSLIVITGNMIISIIGIGIVSLAQWLSDMKMTNSFEYYAAMRVNKLLLILAIISAYAISSIPGMISVLLIGSWMFKFPLSFHPLLLPMILLTVFSSSGIGAMIGTYTSRVLEASVIANASYFLIIFFSPIFVPHEELPRLLQITSYLLPSRYATHGLRHFLKGGAINDQIVVDFLALFMFALLSFLLISKKFEWREV